MIANIPQPNGSSAHPSRQVLAMALDRELSAAEASLVERHLQACGECQAQMAILRQASEAVAMQHNRLNAHILVQPAAPRAAEQMAVYGVQNTASPLRSGDRGSGNQSFRLSPGQASGYNVRNSMSTAASQPAPIGGNSSSGQGSGQSSGNVPPNHVLPTLFGDGYGIYQVKRGSFVASYSLVTAMAALLVWSGSFIVQHQEVIKKNISGMITDISPYVLPVSKTKAGGGGGGGDHDKFEASKGSLPKFAKDQFTPPVRVIRNDHPVLPMAATVVVPPQIKIASTMPVIGDPYSHNVNGPESNGTGTGGGIGSGSGGGIGSGTGPGVGPGYGGGIGGGIYSVGGGVSAPKVVYDPNPDYSDEARKAKYSGVCVLYVVVGEDGRVRDVRIQRSLGMGLDEEAIKTVRTWKFEPARKDGRPVSVAVNIEVNFHLY